MFIWFAHLFYTLKFGVVDFTNPVFYLHVLFQSYIYTGLFITAHDAMHGTVMRKKGVNKVIGTIASFLYAGMSYNRLIKNHFKHHKNPGSESDPDFNIKSQNFFVWWASFMFKYATITQVIIMAAAFNILKIWVPEKSLWFFWVIRHLLARCNYFSSELICLTVNRTITIWNRIKHAHKKRIIYGLCCHATFSVIISNIMNRPIHLGGNYTVPSN
jgi:beta-carotene ketolase (CrtW type)